MKKVLAIIFSSLLLISAVACSNNKPSTNPNNTVQNNNETTTNNNNTNTTSSNDDINLDKAIELALREVDGTVIKAEFENGTNSYYEIDIVKDGSKHEVEVEAKTGNILKNNIDKDYTNNLGEIKITLDEAKKIAIKSSNGGVIKSFSLEKENNIDYYDFDIINGADDFDVEINALDGSVIKSEKDLKN